MPSSEYVSPLVNDNADSQGPIRSVNYGQHALRWRWIVTSPLLPVLVAAVLYSVVLTDDLFGDEFAQYRWSVLGAPSSLLDINTHFARLGYLMVGQPWAIRLHSIIFSLGSVILIWMLACKLFNLRTAIFAAWIAALSPYVIEFAAESRPNAIFIFAGAFFLFAFVSFIENENWANTLLLAFSISFGLLARPMFVAILLFGLGYYILRYRRISGKLCLLSFVSVPLMLYIYDQMSVYSQIAPKESPGTPVSLLNILFRLPMSFTFGFCTLKYPPRDLNLGISISETVSQNLVAVVAVCIVFYGLVAGCFRLLRYNRTVSILLICCIVIPVWILLLVQESGFSLLNEKHCAGVLGPFCVLLAGIFVVISKHFWGQLVILLYVCLIGISLFHYYFEPEIYSRRSNCTALNSFLYTTLEKDDYLLTYHLSERDQPNYFTVFGQIKNHVNLLDDRPDGMSLAEYAASVNDACSGKLFFIYSSSVQGWVDPSNSVLPVLKNQRDFTEHYYGRNLILYEFLEIHESKSPKPNIILSK